MNRIGLTYLVATVLAVGIVAIGYFSGVKPLLDAASAATTERTQIEANNQMLELRIAQLTEARDGLATHEERLAALQRALPADGEYQSWLAELDSLAAAAGVSISQVTVADSQQLTAEAPPADPAAPADTATPPADGAAAPAPADPAAPPEAPVAAAPGSLLAIPVLIGVEGPAGGVRAFIQSLQAAERLTLASRFALSSSDEQPDVLDGTTSAQIDGLIWVLPE